MADSDTVSLAAFVTPVPVTCEVSTNARPFILYLAPQAETQPSADRAFDQGFD
jgi:hypothetical protein